MLRLGLWFRLLRYDKVFMVWKGCELDWAGLAVRLCRLMVGLWLYDTPGIFSFLLYALDTRVSGLGVLALE